MNDALSEATKALVEIDATTRRLNRTLTIMRVTTPCIATLCFLWALWAVLRGDVITAAINGIAFGMNLTIAVTWWVLFSPVPSIEGPLNFGPFRIEFDIQGFADAQAERPAEDTAH